MIGNDVIDLAQARRESNWRRKGFLEKLYTLEEREVIQNGADTELYVWLFWSMKEAAYKIYNRETGLRAFMPHQLECTIDKYGKENYQGRVAVKGTIYTTQTIITGEMIHTIALPAEHSDKQVIFIDKPVYKDGGDLPFIRNDKTGVIAVSKSHHGRYMKVVALGCLYNQ